MHTFVSHIARRLVAALSALSVLLAGGIMLAESASASVCQIVRGAGYMVGNKWVGSYMCGNVAVYCPDPLKSPANPTGTRDMAVIAGATGRNVDKLSYGYSTYGVLTNAGQPYRTSKPYGAAMKMVTWHYTGQDATRKQAYTALPAVRSLYDQIIKGIEANYGPYAASLKVLSNPTIGKTGAIQLKVVSTSTGRGIPGLAYGITGTNAKLGATSVKTNASGYVNVAVTRLNWSDMLFTATSKTGLPAHTVKLWVPPSSTYQRFLSASARVKSVASAKAHIVPVNIPLTYTCGNVCNGIAPVQFAQNVCNTYGGAARFVMRDNNTAQADVLSLAVGACANKTWKVADTHTAQIELQVYVGGKWVITLLPNKIIVDCPPWPTLKIETTFTCTVGTITATAPAGPHAEQIIVNGNVVAQGVANQALEFTTGFSCDVAHTYLVQTASQRNNGSWHTSPAATVVSPVFGS